MLRGIGWCFFFQKSLLEVYKKFHSEKCAIRESNSGHLVGNEVS